MKRLFLAILFVLAPFAYGAGSSINPAYPPEDALVQSAPLRSNFLAAYNDINALIGQNAGPTAPLLPLAGQLWLNTGATPYALSEYDGAAWVVLGRLDPVNHVWTCAVASGCTGMGGPGAAGNVLTSNGTSWVSTAPVPAPTVATANGFSGTVSNATTAPAITLSTTQSGILQGINGNVLSTVPGADYSVGTASLATGMLKSTTVSGALSIGVPGTDYSAGTASLGTGLLKSTTGTGGLSIAVSGTDYYLPGNALGTPSSATLSNATGLPLSTGVTGVLGGVSGGTGVNNGGKTITLGGNLTTSGAFNTTLNESATTNVTLPTSGTIISSSTSLPGAVTGTPSSLTFLRGDGTWAVASPVAAGFISGFTLSNDGTSPNTVIDVAAGFASDSTNAVMINGTALTKQISGSSCTGSSNAFVSGTGNCGMFGTAVAASTWYHVFAIIVNGGFDVYFDTSATAANKPSGATYARYIGSIKTNSSSQVIGFTQYGQRVIFTSFVADLNTTAATSEVAVTLSTPPGFVVHPFGVLQFSAANQNAQFKIFPATAGGIAGTVFDSYLQTQVSNQTIDGQFITTTNTSSQIYYSIANGSSFVAEIVTNGYINPHLAPSF